SFHNTLAPPAEPDGGAVREPATTKAIAPDGETMRVFAHFQSFASGAKPIVEIVFDAEYPDRVGFLPHPAPDSAPLKSCQFVTQFDARFFWRKIEMLPDSLHDSATTSLRPLTVPLSQLYPQLEFSRLFESNESGVGPLSWRNIPLPRLPLINPTNGTAAMRCMSLITDVADSSQLKFPPALSPNWQYQGVANRQVWWLPTTMENDASETEVTVDVRAVPVFPTTTIRLPGGPAIGNVRITVPMPATQPVWLEIVADSRETK
ncbi:MAG: hypothetical protein AAF961_13920, partial [Planctomycetota bacterium]